MRSHLIHALVKNKANILSVKNHWTSMGGKLMLKEIYLGLTQLLKLRREMSKSFHPLKDECRTLQPYLPPPRHRVHEQYTIQK